jgi:hypothetical protein
LKGGEQDRTSATWQLIAYARAAGDKFKPGSEWKMFVAGRRDAEPWSFKVLATEKTARLWVSSPRSISVKLRRRILKIRRSISGSHLRWMVSGTSEIQRCGWRLC